MGFEHISVWQVYDNDGRRKYLDADERMRFLATAQNEPPAIRALCYLLIHCGCRITEALEVRRDQLDIAGGAVLLRTLKRRKQTFRRVPLPIPVLTLLLEVAPPEGRIWSIHRATAWRWITRVMRSAKVQGPMACCRGARHAFAMHAASRTIPPNLLQKWMGHASLATTAIYIDAVGSEERAFAERLW